MVNLDYFLGTAYNWLQHADGNISVHLCQSAFTEFTANRFSVNIVKKVPRTTPYRSGFPIESIPTVDALDPDLTRQKQVYQSIFGFINWLATFTHPDIVPALTFIASYSNYPHPQHYRATGRALKYLTSKNEYSISFHSNSSSTIQEFNNLSHHHNMDSYTESTAPSP